MITALSLKSPPLVGFLPKLLSLHVPNPIRLLFTALKISARFWSCSRFLEKLTGDSVRSHCSPVMPAIATALLAIPKRNVRCCSKRGHRNVAAGCPLWADAVEKGLVIFSEQ
jgi:hypothetical protein